MLRVIIFDVEHGFCAFVKSPTGCTLMIDCGRTEGFSPVDYILRNELHDTATHNGHRLTQLIVTHPHHDHLEDIPSVALKLPPFILQRQRYSWETIKTGDAGYENLDLYASLESGYNLPVNPLPQWGMEIQTFCLTPTEAFALDKSKYVNNSSIVTVVSYKGTEFTEKFLFGGDIEQSGWEALLTQPDFRTVVKDTDFYIASHHGHSSGFSSKLYEAMGRKPILNIVSVHRGDENLDARYSSKDFALGMPGREATHVLSTRKYGSIFIDVDASGKYTLGTYVLGTNTK